MQTRTPFRLNTSRRLRAGFTLVEMLVAVGLVVLMLAMFGEVFSIATKSMSKMKGVSENDQKARMLTIIIRGDLQNRTYRQVLGEFGIHALQGTTNPAVTKLPSSFDDVSWNTNVGTYQKGYVYISENNPNDQTDDMIQFTIDVSQATNNFETPVLYGRALQLGSDNTPLPDGSLADALQNVPDQPVFDDQAGRYSTGILTSDQTGSSSYAEVAYFLRNGNLYRRQMLIRQPVSDKVDNQARRSDVGKTLLTPNTTQTYGTGFVWNPSSPAGSDNLLSTGSFWNDFDYSAVWDPSAGLRINGVNNPDVVLDNSTTAAYSLKTSIASPKTTNALGFPGWRFGFIPHATVTTINPPLPSLPYTGGPVSNSFEYPPAADSFGNINYLGRFTQQETSASGFIWPGAPVGDGSNSDHNPMSNQSVSVTNGIAALNGNQYVGPRVSQDLLATNVHEFDVKVWDDWASNPITGMTGMFVDIGGANASKYLASNNQNYGSNNPFGFGANVYDTWHPAAVDATGNILAAPFRNNDFGNDGQPGVAGVDDNKNGLIDQNDIAKDPVTHAPILDQNGNFIYNEQGAPGSDDWHDMKAIAIHIRYYDVPSDSMRDLTILHSFVE